MESEKNNTEAWPEKPLKTRGEEECPEAWRGKATTAPLKGPVSDVLYELSGGLRRGMTYLNASEIGQLGERALFMEMSPRGLHESGAHGLRKQRALNQTFGEFSALPISGCPDFRVLNVLQSNSRKIESLPLLKIFLP